MELFVAFLWSVSVLCMCCIPHHWMKWCDVHVISYFVNSSNVSVFLYQLALYVLSYLEPRDLARASQTCHYWHILAEDNLLWREKCREEGLNDTVLWGGRVTRRRPQSCASYTLSNTSMKTSWKHVYKRQKMIENNWSRSPLQPPKVYSLDSCFYLSASLSILDILNSTVRCSFV